MSALPRPALPAGAQRDLSDALHDLHHHAGWPSLRTLAREAGVSHTTVSKAFSAPALPSWGTLELLVEAMHGDTTTFHELWLAASSGGPDSPAPAPRIAGRKRELAAVRRHLESGTGLLLVTGEAGIGKTTLVQAAVASTDTVVAVGRCLPLSTEVPLLPVAEALRQLHDADDGRLLAEALASCPPYVKPALGTLLPELTDGDEPIGADGTWSRHRLFSAVAAILTAVSRRQPCAVLLDDLHWSDLDSLDLVEHLAQGAGVSLLATWRVDDPDVPQDHLDWCARVRRSATSLELGPLTQAETAEQLALLGNAPSASESAVIHARSLGQPLFTEQLALADTGGTPTFLGDLLDRRISGLDGPAWRAASALGVADRPLTEHVVGRAAGLPTDGRASALRRLRELRLLDVGPDSVHLRHPLLAEAVRRRLLPSEATEIHRNLAHALSEVEGAEPAEVARHWQAAGDPGEELVWRIRAAGVAAERYAGLRVADQWLRVLELWPEGQSGAGVPPIRRNEAIMGAVGHLDLAGRPLDGVPLLTAALASPESFEDVERADQLRILARSRSSQFTGTDEGLELIDRAIELYRRGPVGDGLASALNWKGTELEWHGRREEGTTFLLEAARVAAQVGDPLLQRSILAQIQWTRAAGGDDGAVEEIERLLREIPGGTDPQRDLGFAIRHTDILLMACRPAHEVERASLPPIALAERWFASSAGHLVVVKSNLSQAWRRAGLLARALAVVADDTADVSPALIPFLHTDRAILEVLAGNADDARHRLEALVIGTESASDPFGVDAWMQYDVWVGHPADAFTRFDALVADRHDEISPGIVGDLFALATRAAADMSSDRDAPARRALAERIGVLRAGLPRDPFSPGAPRSDRAAEPQFSAELARLAGNDTVEQWVAAAGVWDEVERPHDAAYCRWRGAQLAVREGRGTVAARLLARAAADSREHVPLHRAITATREGR